MFPTHAQKTCMNGPPGRGAAKDEKQVLPLRLAQGQDDESWGWAAKFVQ